MDDSVHLLVLHQLIESVEVANVHLDKLIVGLLFYILQVCEVARICQFIEINDVVFGIFVHEKAHHMAPDETCSACDYYCLHLYINFYLFAKVRLSERKAKFYLNFSKQENLRRKLKTIKQSKHKRKSNFKTG